LTERRRFLRFDTAINALCDIVNQKHRTRSSIRNISKEGALVILDKPLEEGSDLNLSMDVPGDNIPVFASCKVAWQKSYKDRASYETGVRFTRMSSSDKGRLLEYIYLQWLKVLDGK
jgi:c-di-GMP-binding flagellar brake protein YcgR